MQSTSGNRFKPAGSGSFSSAAWLLRGISSVPGVLRLSGSQVSFVAQERGSAWDWQLKKLQRNARDADFARKVQSGSHAVLFNEPLEAVTVRFPWYYFSGGLIITARGQGYRLSFGQAASSSMSSNELETVSTMRRVGKRWRQALAVD